MYGAGRGPDTMLMNQKFYKNGLVARTRSATGVVLNSGSPKQCVFRPVLSFAFCRFGVTPRCGGSRGGLGPKGHRICARWVCVPGFLPLYFESYFGVFPYFLDPLSFLHSPKLEF